jgi:pimeloyl-ACP methyl ester carboxylesterase
MGSIVRELFAALLIIGTCLPSLAQERPHRPLIFVPGILGSRLCDANGTVVWGTGSSLVNFAKLELGRDGAEGIKSCGLIDKFQLLGSLLATNQYNTLLSALFQQGYLPQRRNLYIFDYDWRISNYENAERLDEFIRQRLPNETHFDIIAHSMGGIVSRIYMDEYASSKFLDRIVYLGTPFLGSMDTFGLVKEGLLNRVAGGQDVVWRVALSFPSMLELLPRYDQCCYIRKSDGSQQFLDVFDPTVWRQLSWLPREFLEPDRFNRFGQSLRRSKGLTSLLIRSAPSSVAEFIFASDSIDTFRRIGMREGATTPREWFFSKARGDGTVPVWSVARQPKSDTYSNTLPSFGVHAHLFDDKWVINKIERSLKDLNPNDPDPIGAPGRPTVPVMLNGIASSWPIETVDIETARPFVRPGADMQADLIIKFDAGVRDLASNVFEPKAFLVQSEHKTALQVREISQASDLVLKHMHFIATGNVPEREGAVEIVFEINDSFTPSKAFYVTQGAD